MAGNANILGEGDKVLSVEEPVKVKVEDKVPTIETDAEKTPDTEPGKEMVWGSEESKLKQAKDQEAAAWRKFDDEKQAREQAEAKLQEAIEAQGKQMSSAIADLAQTMKGNPEDPRAKLVERLDALDEDDEDYNRKSKDLLKQVLSIEPPKAEAKGVDPEVLKRLDKLDSFETELQSLRSELSIERGTNNTNSFLDRLDEQYGTKRYRNDAIAHVKELNEKLPKGTPDEVFQALYEDAYKLQAAKEPSVEETKVPESLAGVKGSVVADTEEDGPTGMLDTAGAKAKMMARLKGVK